MCVLIAMKEGGLYYSIRVLYDNPEPVLRRHYVKPMKVRRLFELGDLYTVGPRLGFRHPGHWRASLILPHLGHPGMTYESLEKLLQEHPYSLMTTALGRDRLQLNTEK